MLDIARIASRIASDAPMAVIVPANMCDGSGEDVEYEVECEVEPQLELVKVIRKDTAQEVDVSAFKVVYGKIALMKLWEAARERATEIETARREETLDAKPGRKPRPAPPVPPAATDE